MDKEQIKGVIIENDVGILTKYKNALGDEFDISVFNDANSSLAYIIENNLDIYFYIMRYKDEDKDSIKFFSDKINKINPQIKLVLTDTLDEFNAEEYPNSLVFVINTDIGSIV